MKYYKVIDKNYKAKDGGSFDYKDYLPKENKKGKWTPKINNPIECEKGYHITPYWNIFLNSDSDLIFEVEVKGLIEKENTVGVIDKYVCSSIRYIKQYKPNYNYDRNTGYSNTGYNNTGNSNTGNRNTGYSNTGNNNTGDSNTGDSNTGYKNTGYSNTGDWNTGYNNTGYRNNGNWNTGDLNTGNRNTGDWNTCNKEIGFFNTTEPEKIRIFNKLINKNVWEKCKKPNFIYFELIGDYKKSFIKSFNNTTKKDIKLLLQLPNFDYKVFEEISGISEEMIKNNM